MGCYPLGEMVSKAFGKCSGKKRKTTPGVTNISPPTSYLYSRPKTVVKTVNFSNETPVIIIPAQLNRPVTPTCEPNRPVTPTFTPTGPVQKEPAPVQLYPPHCHVMSPLPRWEERPRRREYFSREYYYYPTPIRESIYNIATDPNRLTAIFSEENPNACSII